MLKNFYRVLLPLILTCLLFCGSCAAAEQYHEELTLPVNSYLSVGASSISDYEYDHDMVETVKDGGNYKLLFKKTGDTIVNILYPVSLKPLMVERLRILVHVIPSENYNPEYWEMQGAVLDVDDEPAPEVAATFPAKVLELVNIERKKVGARPLRLANDLQRGAMIRAQELTKLFSHTRPDGRKCYTVLGMKRNIGVGENIAAGNSTPKAVVEQWMNSPGHRRNILDKRYSEIGVGYCYDADGIGGYKHYWVQIFRF